MRLTRQQILYKAYVLSLRTLLLGKTPYEASL